MNNNYTSFNSISLRNHTNQIFLVVGFGLV
uniref:Uncharacterized protein n=1 Tax=Rhizophora mucronata TaxID=61149 RepID=A0A2P2QF52_RHIMU